MRTGRALGNWQQNQRHALRDGVRGAGRARTASEDVVPGPHRFWAPPGPDRWIAPAREHHRAACHHVDRRRRQHAPARRHRHEAVVSLVRPPAPHYVLCTSACPSPVTLPADITLGPGGHNRQRVLWQAQRRCWCNNARPSARRHPDGASNARSSDGSEGGSNACRRAGPASPSHGGSGRGRTDTSARRAAGQAHQGRG